MTTATDNEESDLLSDATCVTTGDCTCQCEAEPSDPKLAEDALAGKTASPTLVFDGDTYKGLHMAMEGPNATVSPHQLTDATDHRAAAAAPGHRQHGPD